jgi:agmatine/peptidylarginine deiminase
LELARTIANTAKEKVGLQCPSSEVAEKFAPVVLTKTNIVVGVCSSNCTWARDTAPTFCLSSSSDANEHLEALDW